MRRLTALILMLVGLSLAGTAGYIYTHADPDPLPQADVIVDLSGPGAMDVPFGGETVDRTDRGIALFEAGIAPLMVMSGGIAEEVLPSAGQRMANHAVDAGVPEEAILIEGASQSTLQNARFTMDLEQITPDMRIVVVTNRYHLPRSWASFRWAGFQNITLVAADEGPMNITLGLLLEGVKWPFNVARAAGASIADLAGAPREQVDPWLR